MSLISAPSAAEVNDSRAINSIVGQFCWKKPLASWKLWRLHSNAASLSAGAGRYLKVKIEPDRVLLDRLIIAAHLVSPPFCVAHFRFVILIFARRDYGALGA